MRELVTSYSAESSKGHVLGPIFREVRRLQDAGREGNLVGGSCAEEKRRKLRASPYSNRAKNLTRVIGVDLAWDHVPHALVHLTTDLDPHATLVGETRLKDVTKVVVLSDWEVQRVVALKGEGVFRVGNGGVADLVGDGVGL